MWICLFYILPDQYNKISNFKVCIWFYSNNHLQIVLALFKDSKKNRPNILYTLEINKLGEYNKYRIDPQYQRCQNLTLTSRKRNYNQNWHGKTHLNLKLYFKNYSVSVISITLLISTKVYI